MMELDRGDLFQWSPFRLWWLCATMFTVPSTLDSRDTK
eukprot:gene13064-20924_t